MPTYDVKIQLEYVVQVEAKNESHAERLMDDVVYDEIGDCTKYQYVFEKVSDDPSNEEIELEE